jgi:hypothetical protein
VSVWVLSLAQPKVCRRRWWGVMKPCLRTGFKFSLRKQRERINRCVTRQVYLHWKMHVFRIYSAQITQTFDQTKTKDDANGAGHLVSEEIQHVNARSVTSAIGTNSPMMHTVFRFHAVNRTPISFNQRTSEALILPFLGDRLQFGASSAGLLSRALPEFPKSALRSAAYSQSIDPGLPHSLR